MAAKLLGDEYVNQQIILIDFASTPRASVIKCRWDDTFTEVADINDEYTLTSVKITTGANVSGTKEGEIISGVDRFYIIRDNIIYRLVQHRLISGLIEASDLREVFLQQLNPTNDAAVRTVL